MRGANDRRVTDARHPTAGDALARILRELVLRFDETEPAALANEPDGVHRHRSAVRGLRSALAVFRRRFDADAVDELRSRLDDWGASLGAVRDHEVAAAALDALLEEALADIAADVADETDADAGGEAGADVDARAGVDASRSLRRLVEAEREAALEAHARRVAGADPDRLGALHRALHAFAERPPFSPDAGEPAAALREAIEREARRVLRRARRMDGSLESRHAIRKRARRLDGAIAALLDAEAAADPGASPDRALRKAGRAAHRIQRRLGRHRDAALVAQRVQDARDEAAREGEDLVILDAALARARAAEQRRARALHGLRRRLRRAVRALEER